MYLSRSLCKTALRWRLDSAGSYRLGAAGTAAAAAYESPLGPRAACQQQPTARQSTMRPQASATRITIAPLPTIDHHLPSSFSSRAKQAAAVGLILLRPAAHHPHRLLLPAPHAPAPPLRHPARSPPHRASTRRARHGAARRRELGLEMASPFASNTPSVRPSVATTLRL